MDVIEPVPFATRTENLDFIFGTDSVAEITLTIDRSEWTTLLENYDTNPKNEDCIHADFKMTKGEYTWQAEDIGMRLRGNTSRIRPQQGDNYYQAHFKIDFEEWIEDDTIEEGKLAGCMKGIILKRFKDDPTYVREVFGYNFFRKNGIWTAPRAGYTRLFINIVEDGGETTELDYGVYAMIEEINKQFLKERSEITPQIGTKFNGNKGNLWKCSGSAKIIRNFLERTTESLFLMEETLRVLQLKLQKKIFCGFRFMLWENRLTEVALIVVQMPVLRLLI